MQSKDIDLPVLDQFELNAVFESFLNSTQSSLSFVMETQFNEKVIDAALHALDSEKFSPLLKNRFLSKPNINNAERKLSWLQSRQAILSVLRNAKNLKIEPELSSLSLSHTDYIDLSLNKHPASIAILCKMKPVNSIGVDLEWSGRTLSEGIGNKIVEVNELKFNLPILSLWVIKEACFKAFPDNENTVISQYQLHSVQKLSHSLHGKVVIQNQFLDFCLLKFKPSPQVSVSALNEGSFFWVAIGKN